MTRKPHAISKKCAQRVPHCAYDELGRLISTSTFDDEGRITSRSTRLYYDLDAVAGESTPGVPPVPPAK